ncbi:hypothetical protein TNCV_2524491 [Trichonephila clavipes]|nr:hypothetical protein TNCV_2524491 [Trichonephila clavipes]
MSVTITNEQKVVKWNVSPYQQYMSYLRSFGDGPRHFKPWSSDKDDTNGWAFELSTDLTCITPPHGESSAVLGSVTLTTRLPPPSTLKSNDGDGLGLSLPW